VEALGNFLTDRAVLVIPPSFSLWVKQELERCIQRHDTRETCSRQTTYRLGVDSRLSMDLSPNLLSVHSLKCIYFKHARAVSSKPIDTGFKWMLDTDVIWDWGK
jgi:hypothetical protein